MSELKAGESPQPQKEVSILMTSKTLIKELKKLQDKHGVFVIAGLCSKSLLNGHLKPAELTLLKMREQSKNPQGGLGKVNHCLLVDGHAANLITGNKEAIAATQEAEIKEAVVAAAESELKNEEVVKTEQINQNVEAAHEETATLPNESSNPLGY